MLGRTSFPKGWVAATRSRRSTAGGSGGRRDDAAASPDKPDFIFDDITALAAFLEGQSVPAHV